MPDLFSTDTLIGVVQNLKQTPRNGVLQRYFGSVEEHDTEEIHFDLDDRLRRIAPFVHPRVPGKVVRGRQQQVRSLRPAYVKDKRVFEADRPLKRIAGEPIAGTLDPQTRLQALIVQDLADMSDMLDRRLELMAASVLLDGALTLVGEDYPSTSVDYNRAAALDPAALTSTAAWDDAGSDPLGNLQTWGELVAKTSGATPLDVIMGIDAWSNFRKHADVKDALDKRWVTGQEQDADVQIMEGLTRRARLDGFNIFTYTGWYVDPADDTEKVIWDSKKVVVTGPELEGFQAFGAIKDLKALRAMRLFVKSWEEEDPSVRYVMGQSAPLVVPGRINASLAVKVLE